ncbi:MAG: ABC transporter permease [Rhizobiales bacterium]|nr:ABC transporter permease [Hyphomicrobiales bacterium]
MDGNSTLAADTETTGLLSRGASQSFRNWFNRRGWRNVIIASPYGWLLAFFLLPFLIVIVMSLATRAGTSPPFAFADTWPYIDLKNIARLFQDPVYIRAYLTSIYSAGIATVLCLLLGYPMALAITRVKGTWRGILLLLVILPFWTSFLLRVYAWIGLMGTNSWFNKSLTAIINGVIPADMALRSIPMMNTNFAVILVMVYSYLPFMILPLYANLERLDGTLNEAAMDLGSKPWQVFRDITLPLSLPGIIAGGLLVFIPASGEVIIPSLVGDASDPMIGRVINDEFSAARDWPMASAVAVALLFMLVVPMMLYHRFESRAQAGSEAKS